MLPPERRSPAASRLPPDPVRRAEIIAIHEAALEDGRPAYVDPDAGLMVLTAAYLWARGWCCETGCRHCPWVEPRD